jgi:hypothetical protein
MPRLSFYVLRQLIGPVALFTFLLTSVIWLSQSLRLLDLVINRGQSAPTFVYLTVLILPGLLVIILPIAFFAGTLFGLQQAQRDSELVVMSGGRLQPPQLLVPCADRRGDHDGAHLSVQPLSDAARPARDEGARCSTSAPISEPRFSTKASSTRPPTA